VKIQLCPSNWYQDYCNWSYRKPINISNTAGNQTNYQVLVNLTSSNFNFSKANSDGNDTRFTYYNSTSGTETEISYWIESWNSTANTSKIWVKVPFLENNTNTTIYILLVFRKSQMIIMLMRSTEPVLLPIRVILATVRQRILITMRLRPLAVPAGQQPEPIPPASMTPSFISSILTKISRLFLHLIFYGKVMEKLVTIPLSMLGITMALLGFNCLKYFSLTPLIRSLIIVKLLTRESS